MTIPEQPQIIKKRGQATLRQPLPYPPLIHPLSSASPLWLNNYLDGILGISDELET